MRNEFPSTHTLLYGPYSCFRTLSCLGNYLEAPEHPSMDGVMGLSTQPFKGTFNNARRRAEGIAPGRGDSAG